MKKENIEDIYRLSPIQHGMLFHSLYAPESGVYFEQFLFDWGADFDPDIFEKAWRTLVDHHPVLRTSFLWADLKDPVQVVHRKVEIPFDRQDWRNLPAGEQEQRLRESMAADRRRGFDLIAAPLLRFAVLRLAEDSWKILWSYHHLLLDGWSMGILLREFPAVYRAVAVGAPVQVAKRRPFRDYIAWLRQQDTTAAEAYWRRTLAGLTTPTPLGVDRPVARDLRDGRVEPDPGRESRSLRIPQAETAEIKAWCQRQRLTVSTLVHGAWALLLGRYSQERDVLFGSTVSGRPPALPGAEAMLGCFINTLPVRVQVPSGGRVLPFLQGLQTRLVELRRYEHSPLVDVQGWSEVPRQVPLFRSIVVVEGFLDSTNEGSAHQRTNYPLTLVVGPDREMLLRIDYEAAHFDAAAIGRLLGHLRTLVTALPRDPERRLEDLPVLTPPEREQLLTVWNRREVRFPSPLPLHRLFEARAAETPGAVAVTCEGASLTYRELNARANRLARHLRRLGVGPESRVGLCLERSLELVEGILGILKAGGAYVPLDPLYPASRLSLIAEDSGLDVLVTVEVLRGLVPGRVRSVCLDAAAAGIAAESAGDLEGGAGPESLAYVIYTSGSTGRPKGSLLTHANVARLFTATDGWFHFGPEDVWSLFHSFAFDFSVWEIWGALLHGGRLVVVPYWVSRSPEAFHELLVREGVTVLNQTPSAFRQLVQADADGRLSLRYVIFGGEALELSSLGPWFDRHGDETPRLVNMYGITETTVHVTWRVIRRKDLAAVGRSPVGVPIPDLAVYLRDRHGHLVPVGVPGEMFVAGAGVARGYLGRPELTAERFVPDPFGDQRGPGGRLYRSGDLARWLENGDLEYLGRLDHQVKIRGFRIEPGEIEAVLGSHPSVREAVVLTRRTPSGDQSEDQRLVGYVVPRESGVDVAELRAFLKDRLPDYMVPSALVEIPSVPLTAHGKMDARALPDSVEAAAPAEKGFDPPRTPTEELVAGIWSEVLRVERVGREDSFFDLGGHSLLATRVLSRLREVLRIELPLRALFEAPTAAELAPRIEAARAAGAAALPPLEPVSRDGDLPLSFSQERLWFLEELLPGTAVYHIPNAIRMSGALDAEALRRSFAEVVRRHEALRTVFLVKGGRPVQVIREDLQPALPLVDLSALPAPLALEEEVRRLSAAVSLLPFDLAAGPLLRPALLRLEEREHVLLLTFHHIVSDAWSLEVLLRELAALYPAFASGRPSTRTVLPELPVQYADFAAWQRRWLGGALLEEQLAFWRERLAGVPVLQLPADRPRPAVQSHHGSIVPFALPEPLSAAVHALAKARGVTVFMVLLAAYEALLSRYSGQEDFAVGSPVAGRDRREVEGLIGFFVNTLVLRSSLAGDPESPEVTKLLDRVRAAALEAYAHQGVPFERVVQELAPERNLSYSPLFQVMLAFQSLGREALELPGLTLSPQSDPFPVSKFDLTLTAFDSGAGIFGHWVYSTALFDRETAGRWAGHFQVLLEALATEPSRRASELPLLGAAEREQILVEWNRPPMDYPEEGFVHQLFEAQAESSPEAVAVVFEGESLTYRELNERANRLAHRLRRQGAGPEVLVGFRAERSLEMVVGLLAILKAGSAYLPIDPSLPAERQEYMKQDAGIELLLTGDLPDCAEEPAENPAVPVLPDHPAYIIYTSGSTGQPKGVVVSHRSLGNRLQYARWVDVLPSDTFLQKTTISFDVSLIEIFAPLVTGGRTVLARPGGQQDPEYLVRLIREQRITYTSFPPSLLHVLIEQDAFDRCDSLRVMVTGGETVPADLPRLFYERLPDSILLNRYGPTEATISITAWLCERDVTPRTLPIGRPTAKARVYLLDCLRDRALQPVPAGITGEIFLGGLCVARGYHRRPALTAERFVPDPFGGEAGARLYRTGDLARHRPDGAIEFVGRTDQQVKIRGFRVELGEIEAALARHPAVREVAVVDREEGLTRSLAAYLVWEPGEEASEAGLRSFLLESLPAYMVPADFVVLETLPLSSTGKVDRKALPAPRRAAGGTEFEEPQGPVEEILAGIFGELLGLERVSRTGDFFDLGGHSLLAARVMARARELLGVDLALRQLFESPTVRGLAGQVQAARLAPPPIVPVPRGEDLPLSFAQERLWFLDQLQPGSPVYNMPAAVRLHGRLDLGSLRRALQGVVDRHESLRTTFGIRGGRGGRGGRAVQVIAPGLATPMPVVDLQALPGPTREAMIEELAAAERSVPFDLATGPLLRATLLKSSGEDHAVLLTLHHIVTDGWSMGVLVQEIAELYRAFVTGSAPSLPELPIQYADFAVWQRGWMSGETLEAQLGYWRRQLAGLPPLLELPTDRPRPAVQTFRGGRRWTPLSLDLTEGLRSLCRAEGATLFMGLMAAFQSLLHLYSRQDDLAFGSPVAGRSRLETEPLIGFFVNNLVLRGDLAGNPPFRSLLARAREVALGAYAHQDLPFEKLVEELAGERSLSHAPLFQVALVLQNTPRQTLELPGVTLSRAAAEAGTSKFDLTLNALETEESLGLMWAFNRDLFDPSTIERLAGHFETLLAGFLADPDQGVEDAAVLSPEERGQLLGWSVSGEAGPEGLFHELLEIQARRVPDRPAVISSEGSLTYRELNARANQLARRLRRLGVGPEVRVGLRMERSPEMMIALFGILKAGGAYVPLDPAHPEDRLSWMVEDAGVSLVLTHLEETAGESEEDLESGVTAENLAYVIYTSGSTGRPKGVLVPHRGLGNLSAAQARLFQVGEESRILQFASLSFDASVAEIALAMRAGATLCLPPRSALLPGAELVELLLRWEITKVTFPPSVAATLPTQEFPALRTVVVAGEACAAEVAERWSRDRLFVNAYGPTETTVCATAGAYVPGSGHLTLGYPISGVAVYVLGPDLRLAPAGVPGELCIGGIGVVRGYSGRPDLTAERFVPDPFSGTPGARLYCSGDLARFRADRTLDFLGRIDQQVKVRGFRIEPGEIENALLRHSAVSEAVVVAREDGRSERRLVAYLVLRKEVTVDWRGFLARSLPDYMVPSAFVPLPDLPRTTSGKVDRRALPAPTARGEGEGYAAPASPLEIFLADLWKEVLGIETVGLHDDFFALGGSSITGALLINQLQEKLSEIVHVVVMFDAPTVGQLAAYLRQHYPEAVARLFGEAGSGESASRRVDEERVSEMLRVIEPLAPGEPGSKNPPAVFILSPPRSGSTLFRVMLAGHPGLFAPPELELLSFNTLADRRAAFGDRFGFWLEGATRAVMEVRGCDAETAEGLLADFESRGWTTQDLYRQLQEWIGGRLLVDKTPSYALDPKILERAEETFENARYIHLLRHPYGMIRSFEEAKLDQVFFRHPHSFSRRELAELIWLVSQRNILRFLERIPPERQLRVRFEDLLAAPSARLEEVCTFLGIEFRPEMAAPYEDKQRRMTDGIHSWSRMLGDVKFHEHSGVDFTVAEKWKTEYKEDFLGDPTWETAAALGYPRRDSQWVPLRAVPRRAGEPLPLSFSQERLWFLNQLQPESPAYNLPTAVRLRGKLDAEAFRRSLGEVVRRHEALRTRFAIHGGRAVQLIDSELMPSVPVVDLQGLPDPARETSIEVLAARERLRPFDLATGPLLRATLLKSAAEEHVALLTLHHIVSDGWSMGVLIQEIGELYQAFVTGSAPSLPALPVQYADFAVWQREWLSGEILETQLGYWRRQLAGLPPLLELPTDRPRPAVQRFQGKHHRWAVSRPLIEGLEALCRRGHATFFMGLLAVYQSVLQRYTGREDVVVGTPVAGRGRRETEPLIGLFLNSLVLRTDLSGDPDVLGLLERVRKTTLEAFAHQDLPFEKLVEEMAQERNLSHAPLFQVLLVLQNAPAGPMELPGLTLAPVETGGTTAKFDLTLNARETERGLLLLWLYNSDLFDAAMVHRLSGHLETLLAAAVAAPERRLSELPLLAPGEERQILEWNDTAVSYPVDACLHELIEAQVERAPDRAAVVFEGASLTYRELNAAANRLAHRLRGMGVGPEVLVGVFAERSLEMVVGLLAVLKAGGAYLPVDPDYPEDRVAYMLEDASVPVLLTQEHLTRRLAGVRARVLLLGEEAGAGEEANPASGVEAGHLAYVIYTSGSTGRPKGVMNTHRGIVNRLLWMQQEYGLTPEDRVLQKTPFSFDVSVWEFFWPLMTGARLVMARPGGHQDTAYLTRTIQAEGITTLHFVPSMLQAFLEAPGVEACTSLIRVIASGEALPYELQRRFFLRLGAGLHNLYGPTEAAVDVTYWACEAEGKRSVVPIGRPVANTRIHPLDANLRPVPVGVAGELHIGGVQVARGYLGRPELTAERFTPDLFSAEPGARFYKTGDLARYLPDGAVDFLGRIDHQVKLRGLRIELGEIEAAIAAHPAVREAVVLARAGDSDALGAVNLVAYVTRSGAEEPAPAVLRALLARSLPDYMIPSAWVVLGELPLSPNGKVDRKALSRIAPERQAAKPAERVAPRTEMERALAALWSEALGLPADGVSDLGIHDNFFALGGNSITGAILINRLQQVLGEIIHVVAIFDSPTVASMAANLIKEYPEAVARIWGRESLGEAGAILEADMAPPLDEERLAEVRSLIRTLAPARALAPKNPPALFVLSPPRSGSTLLRVMLGGHPGLFAPPELELLNFNTLAERRDAFQGRDAFRLEGLLRAAIEIRGQGPDDARALVEGFEQEGMTTQELYRRLQEWIGARLLVDKTPTYAWDPATLRRAEETFDGARYLHLVRHPYGMIRSFEEARIDQIFFHEDHPFSRRELAESLWTIAHRNVLDFLAEVPEERQHTVRFEDLLRDPEDVLLRICAFLGLEYHPDMAEPYEKKSKRMTDGLHAESRMLGDVKFHEHGSVQEGVADRWREVYTRDFLGDATWQLAARLGYGVEKERVAIELGGWREGEPLPLSFSQERLWFFEQMEPGSPIYHIPSAFRLSGRLDLAALEASFREVIRRHASLRTTFPVAEGRPVQTVSAGTGFHLQVIDLSGLTGEPREAEARFLARELLRQPFDFERGPLLRAALLRLGPEEHGAVFLMHHIVSDGWSMGVLIREVAALYAAFSQGQPSPLPGLPVQYPDYALWQRRWLQGERLEGQLSFWKKALAGVPVLELPSDRPRPPLPSYRGGRTLFTLPAGLVRPLYEVGRAEEATPFMVLLAGFAALLARYSGQEDISIGSPVANRNRAQTELLIGFLVNTLVFRTDLSGGAGFRELLRRVRRTALGAYAHQDLPFDKVVEEVKPRRDPSVSPLFQVMLVVQDAPRQGLELPGIRLSRMDFEGDKALFDLTLSLTESPAGLMGGIEYSRDLFDAATAERMGGHLRTLLAGAAAEPGRRLSELPLLTAAELEQLAVWSRAEGLPWEELCLHEMIEARADRDPDAVAVIEEGERLSYGELEARSNRLAHRLRRLGVGPEVRVGLYLERSLQGVVGILGILKAGGVYVPLDPSYPRERRSWILADSGARVLITREGLRHDLPAGTGVEVLCLDSGWAEIAKESAERPEGWARPENLAYAIYTSGSTGNPKGVEVPHGAVAAYVRPAMSSYGYCGDREDRVLQTASWGFDASIEEVLVSLIAGVAVVLWDGDFDPDELLRRSMELGVTVLTLTPSFLQLWSRDVAGKGAPDLPVNVVITGGEALSPEVARLWPSTPLRNALLVNAYGPTEAVIVATDWAVQNLPESLSTVPIGRPRAGRSARVVDRQGQLVPVGVPGELLLGGSLARGYLARPEATAEKFVPDPFSGEPGARLYRTGDRVRWLPSGDLEFLGRIDHQVKIRGFRIELGEIEAALAALPEVGAATVTTRQDHLGGQHLVAYLVPAGDTAPGVGALREHLAARLPEYMVPSVFVVLKELPLTHHGKVDRKALPAPDEDALVSAVDFVAPRTATEERLARIWEGLLSRRAGVLDDFFQIGGHSLLATQLVSRIREGFGIELPLRRVFELPTLAELAAEIEAAAGDVEAPPLVPVPREGDLPLSFAQERLWFLDQLQPGSHAYNMPAAVRLHGRLDTGAFLSTLREIVRRHESLRTRFAVRGGRPVQVIAADPGLEMPVLDLGALPAERREAAMRLLAAEERRRPFDLANGPLIRATLLRLGEDEHAGLLTLHHIVSDGWSVGVLIREIAALYTTFATGRPSPLPELPVQYADFAVWQREWLQGEVLEAQLAWWRQVLAGHSILQLPTDRPRPAFQRFNGAAERLAFSHEVSQAFLDLGGRQGLTSYMTLLAGFQALLYRYSGQDDVVIGATVAGRDRGELEPLIGFFVNALVMRADLSDRPAFDELFAQVREATLGALSHQHLPFEKLVEELAPVRDLSRSPLFQVVFQLQNAGSESLELPGLVLSPVEAGGQTAKFDIVLNLRETAHGLRGSWSYNTDLFDRATLARMSGHFETLLAGAVAHPGSPVEELPLLTAAERQQLALEWNAAPAESLEGPGLHEIFAARAASCPDAVALSFGGQRLSYGELDRRANGLAWHLMGLGVSPGDLVGLCLEQFFEMVVAILGVLKAGGAYVPLDPAYPRERLAFMLEDSRVPVLLAQESLAEILPETGPGTRVVFLDQLAPESAEAPAVPVSAGDPAYVIYTSGSTGRPKGVVVRHGNVLRLFTATEPWFGFGPEDVWTLFHSYAFDFSVWEIWGALLYGGRLVVVPWAVSRSPEAFYELLRAERVTVLNQTPSAFRQLIWAEQSVLGGSAPDLALRYVIFGGEALEPASLAPWFERHGGERPRLVNMYGITETTVHVTYRPIVWEDVKGTGSVIGRAIPDLGLYVLDGAFQPQPVGVPGEIHVGGAGLALGYLGRPELTAERFVPNPYGEPGSRLYRSGDLARYLPDGGLEYLGRIDHQVKIRGFRIELGEIESALAAHPSVREAVVLAREDGGERRLVAYVVAEDAAPSLTDLRSALAGSLPEYMLPSALVVLDRLPLTANGKVDRRALPAPEASRSGLESTYVEPATDLERFLAGLWQEVLYLSKVGVLDDFFELGGSSITGAVLVSRLQEALREIVHVVVIFDAPTIAEMSAYLIEQHPEAVARLFGPETQAGSSRGRDLSADRAVEEADLEELRRLVRPLPPLARIPAKNPPAVFVLSPPRSGSTLLRVMLGGHPRLFSPPELELLSFNTLQERRAAFTGRDAFWLEGVIRAVMEIRGCDAGEAEGVIAGCKREDLTTLEFYGRLQEWLGGRILVDKTPSYALDPAVLRRAEEGFEEPLYIHLIRHPLGMIHSFEEAKLDQIFFRQAHSFPRRRLAELIWRASHENVVEFLGGVPAHRQHQVRFEDLLREPEAVLRGICAFLGLDYHPDMAEPYSDSNKLKKSARMTDGIHAESRMLGDVKFHQHAGIEAGVAERWRDRYTLDSLGGGTRDLAARLGYGMEERRESIPSVLAGLQPGGSKPPLFLVHPLSGELLLYRHLVSALGTDQPVYGLQAVGFTTDDEPLETVEEMAFVYVRALLAFQPEGPYLLAGSSMGGLIAFEMARQLRVRGREVPFLGLLDSPDPALFREQEGEGDGEAELVILSYLTKGNPPLTPGQMRDLAPEERLDFILQLGRETGTLTAAFGLRELNRLVRVVGANRRALRAYSPEPFGTSLVYLKAADTLAENDAVWAGLALGGVETHRVPGNHLSMHFPPHAEALAARLGSCIERALEGVGQDLGS